jgi:CRISPR system Cascade subunit CasA
MKFNIVTDPWIPVVTGIHQETLSLMDVIDRANEISSLAGDPVERFSIMKLLICIAQAAINGPADEKDWASCKDKIVPAVKKYLKKWRNSFELFGDRPFLQAPTLEKMSNREVSFLNPFYASGANHTLFDTDARKRDSEGNPILREIPLEGIARYLLIKQIFCAGGMTDRSKDGTKWGGCEIKEKSYEGSIASNILLTVVEGDTILDTIHNNLINIEWLEEAKIPFGKPVWEVHITQQSDKVTQGIFNTYLYNLVPLSRSILLEDQNKMSLSNGIAPADLPVYRNPMGTVMENKQKSKKKDKNKSKKKPDNFYLKINPEKAPWRELQSILQTTQDQKGPWALRHLAATNESSLTLVTGGFLYDQAKPIASCEWKLNVPVGMLNAASLNAYGAEVQRAENKSWGIQFALECYLGMVEEEKKLTAEDKKNRKVYQSMLSSALQRYWHSLEKCANTLINDIGIDQAIASEAWIKSVRSCAIKAFEESCGCYKKNITSYVKALQILKGRLYHD